MLLVVHAIVFRESFRARHGPGGRDVLRRAAAGLRAVLRTRCSRVQAVQYGTFTAGGSDSFGYVSQAYGWANGHAAAGRSRLPIAVPVAVG